MQTKYKYIEFFQVENTGKTSVWECRTLQDGFVLGVVKWYGAWRQYCYFVDCSTIYHNGCLRDIANFIDQLIEERKEKKNENSL